MKMKKLKMFMFVVVSLFAWFAASSNVKAAGPTIINSWMTINQPTIWTKEGSPYVIQNNARLNAYASLTIEPGVVVKLGKYAEINIFDSIFAVGTPEEKIVFTSLRDDTYEGDTNGDGNLTSPAAGDWLRIMVFMKTKAKFENVIVQYGSNRGGTIGALTIGSSDIEIRNTEIKNNVYGLMIYGNSHPVLEKNVITNNIVGIVAANERETARISNSIIADNVIGANGQYYFNTYHVIALDARDNWWGDKAGPKYKHIFTENDLKSNWNWVGDGVLFDPWLGKDPNAPEEGCTENCFSNVMFLPGIKSSRLYKNGVLGTEDQLWPPNYWGNDLAELRLDESGKSINNVYTRDVLDEVGFLGAGGNIYKSFIDNMKSLKKDGFINDYNLFAYDWRQNVEDVVQSGTRYPNGEIKLPVEILKTLADSSKSKKVTIVAHSNGGLLAKAIMLELAKQNLTDKVDKIVFVGTPQMGTPLPVLSLLYGYDESLLMGTLVSRSDARTLVENMPGAYGLLPSEKYFARMSEPFAVFSSQNTRYAAFRNSYGEALDKFSEFHPFLIGSDDGRAKPAEEDVEKENVLNLQLLDEAWKTQQKLDNWTPPSGVEVIQLAGWGLDTVSGVEYTEKEKTSCHVGLLKIPICSGTGEYEPIYEPKFTVDGDEVVVAPSALMLSEATNVKRYWVDLFAHNDNSIFDKSHKNIMEMDSMQSILTSIIKNNFDGVALPEYIKTSRPNEYNNSKPRLRMSLYSPLDTHLYDKAGNHTGPKEVTVDGAKRTIFEENIPNSYYQQFGDRKYVGFPEGEEIRVELEGYALGTYTLKLEEIAVDGEGEKTLSHVELTDLPTTAQTKADFVVPVTGLADMTPLEADVDGDGKDDYRVRKVLDGKVVFDTTPPEITISSPQEKEYLNDKSLNFDYAVSDNVSALKDIEVAVFYDGKPLEEKSVDLSLQSIGEHEFSVSAKDEAGNVAQKTIKFKAISSVEAMQNNIAHYAELGLVTNVETQDFLQVKLKELAHAQEMLAKMDAKEKANPKNNQIKLLNKKIEDLVGFIQDKLGAAILSPAKEILIQSLEYIKI